MAGLVPATTSCFDKTWMPGTSPAMTWRGRCRQDIAKLARSPRRQSHAVRWPRACTDRSPRGADLLAQPSVVGPLGAAVPAGAAFRASGAAPRHPHRAVRRRRRPGRARGQNSRRRRLHRHRVSARRHRRLGKGRPRAVLRGQRAEQGVRRAHRARLPYAQRFGGGAGWPDAQRRRHGRGRQPAVR